MAKPSTTHVIEIETGIGEPAFIPLTLGQELQPISVGKKGMWRIESARVLDVHAFVYFDGTALFLQSADESVAASVDGYRVGKAWTELHAPCKIEIGAARLRFRSLLPGARDAAEPPPRQRVNTGSQVMQRPMGGEPRFSASRADGPSPERAAPLAQEAMSFPKAGRPFAPGEFAMSAPQGESTRVAPLEGTWNSHSSMSPEVPRPAAGRGPGEPDATRAEGTGRNRGNTGAIHAARDNVPLSHPPPPHDATAQMNAPQVHHPNAMMTASMAGGPHGSMQPPMHPMNQSMPGGMMGGSIPPMQPGMSPPGHGSHPTGPYPYAGPGIAGPYNSMGAGMHQHHSGAYGSMTGQQPGPTEGGFAEYVAKYKELSPPKRILVILAPFCLIASGYLILFDDPEPFPSPRPPQAASADAGTEGGLAANTPPPPASSPAPVAAGCPPGFVPWRGPAANGAITCVPAGTPGVNPTQVSNPPAAPPGQTTSQPPPPPSLPDASLPASNKTLERQAVDYVAVNDYARAAAVYETLQAQNPNNRVYAEAARILRAKANGNTP